MTVESIIKQVRWCIDKEATNNASFEGASGDDTYLDNIIKSHIGDALFWCSYYGSSQLLNGSSSGGIVVYTDGLTGNMTKKTLANGIECAVYTLPSNFVKLLRVRLNGWHKAINYSGLVSEYSDEYLMLMNDIAMATNEKPVACVIDTIPKKIELYPYSENGQITYSVSLDVSSTTTDVPIPDTLKTGFVYYLAFLTLSAYGDTNANTMLEIAKMNVGLTQSNDT